MATVFEVTVQGFNNNKIHNNIFHVFDGNDNAAPFDIANYFRDEYITPMLPLTTNLMAYQAIRVKSLTAANPNDVILPVSLVGTALADAMPTGVHIWVKLNSLDTTFRSGGKMVGGGVEDSFVAGEPTNAYLDAIQGIYNLMIANMSASIGAVLAIYRPSLSIPGLPVVGIVSDALARGNSTNNRRRKDFER